MYKIGKLVAISGPPASGKDSVMKGLLDADNLGLKKLVTYTTRPRRDNEIDGYDYHFVSESKFFELVNIGELIEYELHGSHWKGAPLQPFQEIIYKNESYIWRVTSHRCGTLKEFITSKFSASESEKLLKHSISIYIGPNDKELLKTRYMTRTSNPNEQEFDKRFDEDMQSWKKYKNRYDHVLKNDGSLEVTIQQAIEIVKKLNHLQ